MPRMSAERVPLGVKPKEIHDTIRALDILDAMERYAKASMPVPAKWVLELKELYPWRRNL
jgi:hypothetical protein